MTNTYTKEDFKHYFVNKEQNPWARIYAVDKNNNLYRIDASRTSCEGLKLLLGAEKSQAMLGKLMNIGHFGNYTDNYLKSVWNKSSTDPIWINAAYMLHHSIITRLGHVNKENYHNISVNSLTKQEQAAIA